MLEGLVIGTLLGWRCLGRGLGGPFGLKEGWEIIERVRTVLDEVGSLEVLRRRERCSSEICRQDRETDRKTNLLSEFKNSEF